MKRNQDRIRPNGNAASVARQPKMVLLTLRCRSLPRKRVRVQFVKVKTGRVVISSVFERRFFAWITRVAEKHGMCLCQFLINAMEWKLKNRK